MAAAALAIRLKQLRTAGAQVVLAVGAVGAVVPGDRVGALHTTLAHVAVRHVEVPALVVEAQGALGGAGAADYAGFAGAVVGVEQQLVVAAAAVAHALEAVVPVAMVTATVAVPEEGVGRARATTVAGLVDPRLAHVAEEARLEVGGGLQRQHLALRDQQVVGRA